MPIEVNGTSYETDEEGYLVNLGDWNQDIGEALAKTDDCELTEAHWEVFEKAIRKDFTGE